MSLVSRSPRSMAWTGLQEEAEQPMSNRKQRMRKLTIEAHAVQELNAERVPYSAHVLSVGRIVDDALNDTRELIADEPHQEDIYLAAVGHDLYEDTFATPQEIRATFGERVDSYIEGMTNRQGDVNRSRYLAKMQGAVEPVKLIKLADLIENTTSCGYGIHDLGAKWIRHTFMPIAGEMIANIAKARFEEYPDTARLMVEWLRFAYKRMVANLDIYAQLDTTDPMKSANAAAKDGGKKGRTLDPDIAKRKLAQMKEQEWRMALLVRGTYLFPRM